MKICAWCSNEFEPNVTYQIYCSVECREQATKEKVNSRYQKKKREKFANQKRVCMGGCGTVLSIYNDSGYCSKCLDSKKVDKALKELRGLIEYKRID